MDQNELQTGLEPRGNVKASRIPEALLDELLVGADPKTAFDANGLLDDLKAPRSRPYMELPIKGSQRGARELMKETDFRVFEEAPPKVRIQRKILVPPLLPKNVTHFRQSVTDYRN